MLVILSQKIDSDSSYADELFNSYHYPSRYRNQLHKGDVFIYYQGNRYDKSQRYYFGIGTIGEIRTADGENYYAKLLDCRRFEKNVPIYLPDGGYIEQLGFSTVRSRLNPPWQSSIRPLSQEAFDYILNAAGNQTIPDITATVSVEDLKERLRSHIRSYFVEDDASAIHRIESVAAAIGCATAVHDDSCGASISDQSYSPAESPQEKSNRLLEYCKTMKMSYSYKPVLILALLHAGDKDGTLSIDQAVQFFREFYNTRRAKGFPAERKRCIYQRTDITDQQIAGNIIANPVRALIESGFFFYNEETNIFSMTPEIWSVIDRKSRTAITRICNERLKEYFGD